MTDRRMQALQRLLGRGSDATADTALRRQLRAAGLGLLVLFTIWGFGRAWHGGWAPVELVIGLIAGGVATAVSWRR